MMLLVAILVEGVLFPHIVRASCGLDYCPLRAKMEDHQMVLQLRFVPRFSKFKSSDVEGHYVENIFRVEFLGFRHWRFGGWMAPIWATIDNEQRAGVSNPVLFVERLIWRSKHFLVRAAMQAELPLGSSEKGLASSHFELLPYISLSSAMGPIQLHGQLGAAIGLEGGEHRHDQSDHNHGEDAQLVVNPHASQELLTRGAAMVHMWQGKFLPGVHFNARTALKGSHFNDVYSLNAVALIKLSRQVSMTFQFELPLNENPRFDWRAGLGVDLKI